MTAYICTNEHGLRLALTFGRVGFLFRATSPANDASDRTGGYPVVTAGLIPTEILGTNGPSVGLQLSIRLDAGDVRVLDEPVPLRAVQRAVFEDTSRLEEFVAGLAVVAIPNPRIAMEADSKAFRHGGLEIPDSSKRADPNEWKSRLDEQERVSAALMLGDIIADGRPWARGLVAAYREQWPVDATKGDLAKRLGGIAIALAKLDPLIGWSAEGLVDALRKTDSARFAEGQLASLDPFEDVRPPRVADEIDEAVRFLLERQGTVPSDLVAELVDSRALSPLASAVIGLAISRGMIPLSRRDFDADQDAAEAEISAASNAIRKRSARTE
jgi:hypothetical protein